MENCFYQGKTICTFDLKDESGIYYEDRVLEWKQAAADRQLICVECGAPVYLAAGPIKEPYFAHYDLEDCEYGNGHESEELKKGKRILYQLLKRSFPESGLRARYRMDNGMYSTLFCQTQEGNMLSIDYRLQNNSLKNFQLRDSFYQSNNIKPVYVMSIHQEKDSRQIDWYQTLLQSTMGYLAFLDSDLECITLKKSFGYRLGKERRFSFCVKTYPVNELILSSDGQMICDFADQCRMLQQRISDEKLQYDKRQEQLRLIKEESLKYKEDEIKRHDAYRAAIHNVEERITEMKQPDFTGLNPTLLDKCRRMIEEGNAHLVSKKYYDAIMSERNN